MISTRYAGIYYRDMKNGDRVFYMRGTIKGKAYIKKSVQKVRV